MEQVDARLLNEAYVNLSVATNMVADVIVAWGNRNEAEMANQNIPNCVLLKHHHDFCSLKAILAAMRRAESKLNFLRSNTDAPHIVIVNCEK